MRYFGPLIFLTLAVAGALQWRRRGWKIPTFVHVLALVGLGLGVGMGWLDYTLGELQLTRAASYVVVMPVLVYIGFFAYSGRLLHEKDAAGNGPDDEAAV